MKSESMIIAKKKEQKKWKRKTINESFKKLELVSSSLES
jgi:hypothetical protein